MAIALIIVFAFGLGLGTNIGRRRALRHLGQAEFAARWRTIRGISRW